MQSSPSRKREAPQFSSPVDAKRPRTPTTIALETARRDSSVKISVEMCEDFSVYPSKLLQVVKDRHERLVNAVMTKFETGTPLQQRYQYTITRASTSTPKRSHADYCTLRVESYPAVSLANRQVLREFLNKVPSKKKNFVELNSLYDAEPKANPEFAELQAVRAGELGWGFDKWGCISLHLTTYETGKLKHESMYVQRREIDVPSIIDDDDVKIVEGPDAART